MNRSRDPALMPPEERLAEVAALLAMAYRRLALKEPAERGHSGVDSEFRRPVSAASPGDSP